jgi:hypothetical protein
MAGFFWGFVFSGFLIVGFVAALIAAFMKHWKLAKWFLIGTFATPLVIFGLLCFLSLWLGDLYVNRPVKTAELVGTYHIDLFKSQHRLQKMGYKLFTGEITLSPDGKFTAIHLPACCISDQDEEIPSTGGYYNLTGSWEVRPSSQIGSVTYEVHLSFLKAVLSGNTVENQLIASEPNNEPNELHVNLLNRTPIALGFSIFNGDFDDILFSRGRD